MRLCVPQDRLVPEVLEAQPVLGAQEGLRAPVLPSPQLALVARQDRPLDLRGLVVPWALAVPAARPVLGAQEGPEGPSARASV